MPSASSDMESKVSPETMNPVNQMVTVVEKKLRNLEKRKGKLDGYKSLAREGGQLNKDQKDAMLKYDQVVNSMEFGRELLKQFTSIKKENDRLQEESSSSEAEPSVDPAQALNDGILDILRMQSTLSCLCTPEGTEMFTEGGSSSVVLTTNDLDQLNRLNSVITPEHTVETSLDEQLSEARDHLVGLLDKREADVVGTTYNQLRSLLDDIYESGRLKDVATSIEENKKRKAADVAATIEQLQQQLESAESSLHAQRLAMTTNSQLEDAASSPVAQPTAAVSDPLPSDATTAVSDQAAAALQEMNIQNAATLLRDQSQQQSTMEQTSQIIYDQEDDSFFSTMNPYHISQAQRPFNEIITSVQGDFNFLQDSEVEKQQQETSPQNIDPAVVAVQTMSSSPRNTSNPGMTSYSPHAVQQTPSTPPQQQQSYSSQQSAFSVAPPSQTSQYESQTITQTPPRTTTQSQAQTIHPPQHNLQTTQSHHHQSPTAVALGANVSTPSSTRVIEDSAVVYSSQQQATNTSSYQTHMNTHSDTFNAATLPTNNAVFSSDSTSFNESMSRSNSGNAGSSTNGGVGTSYNVENQLNVAGDAPPPAIPMPGESSTTDPRYDDTDKKMFNMNPNAAMFQSMYENEQQPQDTEDDKSYGGVSVNQSSNFSSQYRSNASQSTRGINNAASRLSDSRNNATSAAYGNNSYSRGSRNSGYNTSGGGGYNQRSTNNGGPPSSHNAGGGSYTGRSSNGGNMYQGYPSRNDYRPEGYQGGGVNSYNNYNKRPNQSRGMRGGPPRNGNIGGNGGPRNTGTRGGPPGSMPPAAKAQHY